MRSGLEIFITLIAWAFAAMALVFVAYLAWQNLLSRRRRRRHRRRRPG